MRPPKKHKLIFWRWFQDSKLILKLRLALTLMALLTVAVGIGGLFTSSLLNSRVEVAYQRDLPVVSAIKEAGISQLKAMRVLLRIVLSAGDSDEIDRQSQDLAAALKSERTQLDACRAKLNSTAGLAQLKAAAMLIPQFEKGSKEIVIAAKAGDVVAFRSTIMELVPISIQIQHSFDQVSQITETEASKSKTLALATYWASRLLMAPLLIFAALTAAAMSFVMSGLLAAPLTRTIEVLDAVAKGDLTRQLPENSADEMGQLAKSLNHALSSIRDTLRSVSDTAGDLKVTSQSLAATAAGLAEGAVSQATCLKETSESLDRISDTIRDNARHATHATTLGSSACEVAERGDLSVNSAISAMEDIRTSSDEISNILAAINDIAFQSNLLAINASIEAARAGEGGRSFTVVASEMRFLAERSKEYGKNIEQLLATSLDRVNKGSKLVDESGQALSNIISSVQSLTITVGQIDGACKQQTLGVEHVHLAMQRVDAVVQENSAKTQTVSESARRLASAASNLNDQLARFKFAADTKMQRPPNADDFSQSIVALRLRMHSHLRKVMKMVNLAS